jgi:hypothetical protein
MNSYMFGSAVAISKIAELAGRKELADQYRAEAEQLRKRVQEQLWDPEAKFFKVMRHEMAPMNQYDNSVAEVCEPGKLVKVREIFGFVPWYFNMPEAGRGYEEAWRQLTDPQGFSGAYGPTVAERRDPKFFINAAGCMWCGASWPFSTSQTLTALANVLNNYNQDVIGKKEYFDFLKAYTRSHRLTLACSQLRKPIHPARGGAVRSRRIDDARPVPLRALDLGHHRRRLGRCRVLDAAGQPARTVQTSLGRGRNARAERGAARAPGLPHGYGPARHQPCCLPAWPPPPPGPPRLAPASRLPPHLRPPYRWRRCAPCALWNP